MFLFLEGDNKTNHSNYFGYFFNKKARDMLVKIKEVAQENNGWFKLETKLSGNEKIRRQYCGHIKDIKGVMLNNMSNDDFLTYIDLTIAHNHYDVVSFSKVQDKLPNRFLVAIERADKKWAKRQNFQSTPIHG